jgi:hypothetical protein
MGTGSKGRQKLGVEGTIGVCLASLGGRHSVEGKHWPQLEKVHQVHLRKGSWFSYVIFHWCHCQFLRCPTLSEAQSRFVKFNAIQELRRISPKT